ncbi:MAG: VWA domain-containing protein [Acidimicrobiia bacterium]|nr:VWA domain-containing protein [Acidimicrobiia bacterium]
MPPTDEPSVERAVVGFVEALRRAGLTVPVGSTVTFVRALGETGVQREAVYWAGRATLLTRPEDIDVYDSVFAAFWQQGTAAVLRAAARSTPVTIALDDGDEPPAGEGDDTEADDGEVVSVRYSPREVLRHRDFAECSADELAEAHRLMDTMRVTSTRRPSRRQRRAGARGARIDLGHTLRHALRSGGEATCLATTEPGERPRRLVLLADISGSMEPYARSLVRFVHAAVVGRARVEAFTLGTQLTRITRELSSRDPDAAVARAAAAVDDWSGGTRLGDMLRDFNDIWGVRGMARGAVVVILSDGWDRGEPELLAEQMGRLSRVAHRIVWVNPLKATSGYEPLARGMAAALPFVDTFIEGHSLAALEHLAEEIAA